MSAHRFRGEWRLKVLMSFSTLFLFTSFLFSQISKAVSVNASRQQVSSLPLAIRDTLLLQNNKPSKTSHATDFANLYFQPNIVKAQTKKYKIKQMASLDEGELTLSAQVTNSTCENANGIIIASAEGGTAPYQFSIDNNDYTNLGAFITVLAGTYTIHVKDAIGQITSTEVTVTNTYIRPSLRQVSFTNPSGCSTFDGVSIITGFGGLPPYTYSMDRENYQSSGTFEHLPQNWYEYQVKDANGCIGYGSLFAMSPRNCNLTFGLGVGAPNCSATGNAQITVFNGIPPYQYSKDGVHYQDSSNLTNIPIGVQTVYIADGNHDSTAYGIQLFTYCPITLEAAVTDIPCNNPGNAIKGSIIVSVQNGVAPYQYTIDGSNYQESNRFNNLWFGNYTILVKDAEGKLAAITAQVKGGCLLMIVEPHDATCQGNNGSIIVHANGGAMPYQYSIDGKTFQDSPFFSQIKKGTYTVTTKDADGQLVSEEDIFIKSTDGPLVDKVTTTPSSCNIADGTLTIQASGGVTPLDFSMNDIVYQPSNLFTGLGSGSSYSSYVRDANGCKNSICCFTILHNCITAKATTTNATCEINNGTISVTASQGTEPYQYSIDGQHYQNGSLFINLAKGYYTLYVKDNNGLSATVSATVLQTCISVQTATTDVTCDKNNGSITASASGGTEPYYYSIDGVHYQGAQLFSNLAKGIYIVSVKDAIGALQAKEAVIASYPSPQVTATATSASCANHDGNITISAVKGIAPYQYRVDTGEEQASYLFSHEDVGIHTVTVRDANGCLSSTIVTVSVINTLQADAGADVTMCEGRSATLQAISTATNFRWEPEGGLATPNQKSTIASPGITTEYYLYASTEVCEVKDSVMLTVKNAPIPNAGANVSVCYGKEVSLQASGGVSYIWQPATYLSDAYSANPVAKCPAGTFLYLLSATDQQGCTSLKNDTVAVLVTPPPKLFAGNDTAIVAGVPFQLQAVDVNNSGFTAYHWSPAAGLNITTTARPLATIDRETKYIVTASTPEGCAGTDDVVLQPYKGPAIYVPGAFTPNGDGLNDVAKVITIGIKSLLYFSIYDRWGHLMFTTSQAEQGWNGKVNGITQSTGTYIWMVAGIDINQRMIERKGTLVLLR